MAGNTSNTGSWIPQVHTVGLRNVGSYQVSGTPYVTGSNTALAAETKIEFPFVTKSFVINQTAGSSAVIRIHFVPVATAGDVINNRHYVQIKNGQSFEFQVKCKEVYLTPSGNGAQFQLVAELTNIPTARMHPLTGSGISE